MQLFISLFTAVANILLGLFIYNRNPKSATNRLLGFLALQLSFWAVANYFSLNSVSEIQTLLWIRAVMVITAPMGITVFLLLKAFPDSSTSLSQRFLKFLSLLCLINAILAASPYMFSNVSIIGGVIKPHVELGIGVYAAILVVFLAAGFSIIIKKYAHSSGIRKTQIGLLIIGSIIAFGLAAITNFVFVILLNQSSFVVFGPLFSLILVSVLSYAIIKHQLLDIRLVVVRAVTFTLVTLFSVTIYAFVLFRTLTFIPNNYHDYFSITLAIILAYTFPHLNRFIEKLTAGVFYRQPYVSDVLLERLGELLRSTLSLHTLLRGVVAELQVNIRSNSAWFVIIPEKTEDIQKIGYGPDITITHNAIFNLKKISLNNSLVIFDELEESPEKDFLRQLNIAILIPLRVKEKFHGFLFMGDKSSGNIYSVQDINVLEILSPQLSLAVQNALSYEEISQFNITLKEEVEKATSDLKKANKNLKHLDKLKDEFVFIATHELKNPVTAMRGYLSMFKEGSFGQLPAKMKEPMDQLQASNQQLVELVNDLLQIARTEAKTLTINTEPINLCPIINIVKEGLLPLSDQKHISIVHTCLPSMPQVQADAQRVKEIINNLLSNAIKYSDSGTISITHQVKPDKVITHVSDQGVGISPEDQQKLFTRFFRVEEEAAKGIPGTGLGLFIVKQLIEKMGGTIWLQAEKGKGSTFSFSLPTA